MADVQHIKTSVRRHNLLPGRPQLFAAIVKLLKLGNFWAHFSSLNLRLCVNCSWTLTNLRDGLQTMAKRKTKRNVRRLQGHPSFKICNDPMVFVAEDVSAVHDYTDLTPLHGD